MNALKHAASTRKFSAVRSINPATRLTSTLLVVAPLASSLSRAAFSPRLGKSYATTSTSEAIENKDPYIPPGSTPTPPTPTPSAILEASLTFVPTLGWTVKSLTRGAESMGYPSVAHGMFPNGAADLVDYFLEQSRRQMVRELQEDGRLGSLRTHDKIQLACTVRLNLMRPYIKQWPEALAIMGQPTNVVMSLEHLGKLVDDMWFLAGDRSADMNWYTKRASLAAVYASTELYMTQDQSPEFIETFKFLDRRLGDVATVGKGITEIGNLVSFSAKSLLGIIASRGNKI